MSKPTDKERGFVRHLVKLADPENGNHRAALAALRRGLGKRPGEAPEMYPYVVPFAPDSVDWASDVYYLVASLFATHPHNWENTTDDSRRTNLGATLRRVLRDTDSSQDRFVALLNCSQDDLPTNLRHAIALCVSAERPPSIDWAQLLHDIRYWSAQRRSTQREWAWSFWREMAETDDSGVAATAADISNDE